MSPPTITTTPLQPVTTSSPNASANAASAIGTGQLAIMLVANDCRTDARVLKEAQAVQATGFETIVLADNAGGTIQSAKSVEGFHLNRFDTRDRNAPKLAIEDRLFPHDDAQKRLQLRHRWLQLRLAFERARRWLKLTNRITEIKRERQHVEHALHRFYARRHIIYLRNCAQHWQRQLTGRRPAIIQAHDLYTLPAGIWLAKLTGAKLIYDAHEYEPGRYNFSPSERLAIEALEDRAFAHVDRIIVVGEQVGELYGTRFAGPKPTVIFNTPLIHAAAGQAGLRSRCKVSEETPLMVYTGRILGEGRGLDIVLQALAQLPEAHLAILGQRDERHDQWLLSHAAKLKVENRLHLLEPVAPDQVVATIRDADIGLCLIQDMGISYRLCMPNKLFEMTFAELPVIVSDLPELRRFVTEIGHGEIVDPSDATALAQAIGRVLANPAQYHPKPTARQRLTSYYAWSAQECRLQALYGELVGV